VTIKLRIVEFCKKITTKHLFVFFSILLIVGFIRSCVRISTEPAYTIGRIYKIVEKRYEYNIDYVYYVDGKTYEGFCGIPKVVRLGESVLLKFSKKYPDESDILFEYIVTDSIIPNGQVWEEIPKKIVKKRKLPTL